MRLFFFFLSLFTGIFAVAQDSNYQLNLLDKNLTENANAIVRLDEMVVELISQRKMIIKKKRVVTVLNESGDKFTNAYAHYDDGTKVNNIYAEIFDKNGNRLEKVRQKDFKDISAISGGTLYSDSRVLYFNYVPTEYPYTMEFTVETVTQNTGFVPSWYFLDGYMVSTAESKFSILYASPDLKPEIKEVNIDGLRITKSESDNSIEYLGLNIPAIKSESLAPSFATIAPHIVPRMTNFHYEGYDGRITNWKEVGLWAHNNLLKGRDVLPESTKAKVRSLVAGVTDDLDKAKIIYKYVQDNTRYISVQIGIGGKQPISAEEVDRVKYGDCKGLTNYTKALLEAVGVTSYYTQVKSGTNKVDLDEDFATLWQSDHIILALPYKNDYLWADCTSQIHPFGFTGDFTDDRKVLVIKPEGGEIVTTTPYINEQNHQLTKGAYALRDDGSIIGDVTIATKGIQYDNHFGLGQQPEDHIKKHYKNYWDNINNLNIKTYQFQNDTDAVEFTEQVSIDAANYASKSGERLLFAANAFNKNQYIPSRYRDRKLPFEIQRGFLDEDEFTIEIPKGHIIEAIPNAVNIETKFGSYEINFTEVDGKVFLQRKFYVKCGKYPNTDYAAYRDFMKDVAKFDGSKIVIKSTL